MRVIYTKKECRKDRSARNTIGARYLPKNTVIKNRIHFKVNLLGNGSLVSAAKDNTE
jgi:hypothetical protein